MKNKNLSVIILTLNEEKFLPGCLKSVSWADEILIIDAGSTDRTLEIANNFGVRVVKSSWQGFPNQRNHGVSQTKGDWILYVDADERVSKDLREEIENLLKKKNITHNSYKIPHKNIILGKWLKHGGWYPEYQHRLIKKSALQKWTGDLHEHPEVEGSTGYLTGNLIHLTHRGISWMLNKTIRYTKMEAELRIKASHPQVRIIHLFTAPLREFWHRFVIKSGWKDGIEGFIEIIYQSFNHFLIMVWLWEMQRQESMEKTYKSIDKEIADEL